MYTNNAYGIMVWNNFPNNVGGSCKNFGGYIGFKYIPPHYWVGYNQSFGKIWEFLPIYCNVGEIRRNAPEIYEQEIIMVGEMRFDDDYKLIRHVVNRITGYNREGIPVELQSTIDGEINRVLEMTKACNITYKDNEFIIKEGMDDIDYEDNTRYQIVSDVEDTGGWGINMRNEIFFKRYEDAENAIAGFIIEDDHDLLQIRRQVPVKDAEDFRKKHLFIKDLYTRQILNRSPKSNPKKF